MDNDKALPVKAYHKLLVWDIMKKPALTRVAEQLLNPVVGKSFVASEVEPFVRQWDRDRSSRSVRFG